MKQTASEKLRQFFAVLIALVLKLEIRRGLDFSMHHVLGDVSSRFCCLVLSLKVPQGLTGCRLQIL